MDAEQKAFHSMATVVLDISDANENVWINKPFYAVPLQEIRTNIGLIDVQRVIQQLDNSGYVIAKDNKRAVMTPILNRMVTAGVGFASFTNNAVMEKRINKNPSDVERAGGNGFADIATIVLAEIEPMTDLQLVEYGTSLEDKTTLATLLAEFKPMINDSREKNQPKAAATKMIGQLITATRTIFSERLDKAAAVIGNTDPVFFEAYDYGRTLVDPGSEARALEIHVSAATTLQALPGAVVSIDAAGITRNTTQLGNVWVQTLPTGTYSVVVSKAGYVTKTVQAYVNDGETTELFVELMPEA